MVPSLNGGSALQARENVLMKWYIEELEKALHERGHERKLAELKLKYFTEFRKLQGWFRKCKIRNNKEKYKPFIIAQYREIT